MLDHGSGLPYECRRPWCHVIWAGLNLKKNRTCEQEALVRRLSSGGDAVSAQKSTNLGLAVSAVTTERAQRGELPRPGPTRHSLGVDAEKRCYLGRRQQGVAFNRVVSHGSSDAARN